MSKWAGDSTCILAHIFYSVSRQCCDVLASQFHFLHHLKEMFPPSEACLYDHINWSLAQAQQQSSIALSQPFPSVRGCKARPRTAFHFKEKKRPVSEYIGASLAKRHHLESKIEAHPGGRKSIGGSVSTRSADARKKGSQWGSAFLMCYSP